jgi:hypothetical protein
LEANGTLVIETEGRQHRRHTRPAVPRRAHDRPRPSQPQPGVGHRAGPRRRGHDRAAHHPVSRRGRPARRAGSPSSTAARHPRGDGRRAEVVFRRWLCGFACASRTGCPSPSRCCDRRRPDATAPRPGGMGVGALRGGLLSAYRSRSLSARLIELGRLPTSGEREQHSVHRPLRTSCQSAGSLSRSVSFQPVAGQGRGGPPHHRPPPGAEMAAAALPRTLSRAVSPVTSRRWS